MKCERILGGKETVYQARAYPSYDTYEFAQTFYDEYLRKPIDEISEDYTDFAKTVKQHMSSAWHAALSIVELVARRYPFADDKSREEFEESINRVLESEKTAYRLKDGTIEEV